MDPGPFVEPFELWQGPRGAETLVHRAADARKSSELLMLPRRVEGPKETGLETSFQLICHRLQLSVILAKESFAKLLVD